MRAFLRVLHAGAIVLAAVLGAYAPVQAQFEAKGGSPAPAACAPDTWLDWFGRYDRAAVLEPGLGDVHYAVSTRSPAAQRWFDQGLALLYGFAHEDAIHTFNAALARDPKLAMAYWGIAYAYGDNINLGLDAHRGRLAWDALHSAERLESGATPRERGLIEALKERYAGPPCYGTQPDPRRILDRRYYAAMKALHATFPDDAEIAALTAEAGLDLYPWNQWTRAGLPTSKVTLEVVTMLRALLATHPNHPGALHFFIHALEASAHPEDARFAAQRIAWVSPGQAHLVHAASHIYARTGEWDAGMISGDDAMEQDLLYAGRIGIPDLYSLAHSNHNRHFQISLMSMAGRTRATMALGKTFTGYVRPYVKAIAPLEFYLPAEQLFMVRSRAWDAALAYPDPHLPQQFLAAPALWHYARAMAYFAKGQIANGRHEAALLDAFRAAIVPRADSYLLNFNRAIDIVTLASKVAHAREAVAQGHLDAAETRYANAVDFQDHLKYDEPPPWYFPIRESLGTVQLLRGESSAAETTFRDDLQEYPRNGRSLFGLATALTREHKDATKVRAEFQDAWSAADFALQLNDLI